MKFRKYAIGAAVLAIFLLVLILNTNKISVGLYLANGNLTSEVKEDALNYKKAPKNEKDYLVYLYNLDECDKCSEYVSVLKSYEKIEGSFPIYKVDLSELKPEVVAEKLFIDPTQPYVFHIKNGDDFYSYVGGFNADQLPTKTNQAEPL